MFDLEIVRDSLKVSNQSVFPALQITVRYKLTEDQLPLDLKVSAFSEDNKFISQLIELPPLGMLNNPTNTNSESGIESKIGIFYRGQEDKITFNHEMILPLDKKSIDHIEEKRNQTKNNDVVLTFFLTLSVLRPSIRMAKTQKETDKSEELRGDVSYSEYIDSNSDILILKDKDGIKNRLFLKQVKNVKETYRIASSNWVNDFQEHIGVGKFMIIEVPQLNLEIEEIKDNLLNNDQKEFKIRIQRAISIIKDIDNDIRNAEWGNVVKGCRDAIEPFVKNLTPFIKDMLIKTTGIEERNATQLTMSLDNFFGYTSGLHHQINRSGTLATPFIGGKEDAYMSYMVTSSLINSLARKFIRSTLNR